MWTQEAEREQVASDLGVVVWITGRPSSGKTTLADKVRSQLTRRGHVCVTLDGDQVRQAIVPPHGYTRAGRDDFYATLARLAAMISRQGLVVLVPATGHRARYRDDARQLATRFVEVYVDTPADECAARDDKGLYAQARARPAGSDLDEMPGSLSSFDVPTTPDFVAHGGHDEVATRTIADSISRWAA
jgi:adenylylsulfate kinase